MNFLSELKTINEDEVKNVVFKLEIPSGAEELLALKKDAQMAAIEGEEEGDGSFIQNQNIVTVEYITRKDGKIHVYPMLDALKSKDVSGIGARLQKAFNTWCLNYTGDEELDEAVRAQMQDLNAKPGEQVRRPQTPEERKALADKVKNNRAAARATSEFPGSRKGAQSGRSNYYVDRRHNTGMDVAVTNEERGPNANETEAMEAGVVFGEIGEELLKIQSQLDSKLESQLGKLEAKHDIYLGEDLRELKQYIKLAIKSTTKLHESLTDIPMSESMDTQPAKPASYRVTWRGYGKTTPKVVRADFFDDGNGFDEEDIHEIMALGVGEDFTTGGPFDSVTVTRIK